MKFQNVSHNIQCIQKTFCSNIFANHCIWTLWLTCFNNDTNVTKMYELMANYGSKDTFTIACGIDR